MAIKRNPVWKKWLATIGISFVMIFVGAANAPPADTSTTIAPPSEVVTQPQPQGFVATPGPTETVQPETQPAAQEAQVTAPAPVAVAPIPTAAQATPTTTKSTTNSQPTTPPKAVTPAPAPASNNQAATVYVGATGTKYHTQNCRTLKSTKIPMSINDAKSKNYTACKVCNPPQ